MIIRLPGLATVAILLAACGAAGDPSVRSPVPAAASSRATLATPQPPAATVEPTAALDSEGDLRLHEPMRRVQRHDVDDALHPLVMPLVDRRHPRVVSHAIGSISVGTVTTGYLAQGAEIEPEGPHHRVLAKVASRQTRFTTDEMRALLMCAAERVAAKHPGHKLHLGNLSRQGGGTLPWSVSHHNGRDADLAFYARTPRGAVAAPQHLYHFNRTLQSAGAPEPLHFDVAANWTLVKALLTCPGAQVQRMFIAAWLRAPILQYAKKRKEDKELQQRAAIFLAQPRRAMAHDDHLHLRIGCTEDDASEGCLEPGRAPPEALGQQPGVQARLTKLRTALRAKDAVTRAGAAYLLGLYRDAAAGPALLEALGDPDAQVRREVVLALVDLRPVGVEAALARALETEGDPHVMLHGLRALATLAAYPALAARLADPRVLAAPAESFEVPQVMVRRLAVELLADSESLDAARAAVLLLVDPEPSVREAARATLSSITNRTTAELMALAGVASVADLAPAPLQGDAELRLWQAFFAALAPQMTRDAVVLAGFRARGLAIETLDRTALPELVRALYLPAPVRENAARAIERVVQHRPPPGRGARSHPTAFWPTWLVQRRFLPGSALGVLAGGPAGGSRVADDAD